MVAVQRGILGMLVTSLRLRDEKVAPREWLEVFGFLIYSQMLF